ncbi:MAG: hypothetical protein Q8K60_08115 [Parachlamydiaceae bacterium]|nr:hypothetical protein [Parachlamydiaceae bacterium]
MSKFTLFLCSLAIVSGMGYANEDESSTSDKKVSEEAVVAMDEETKEEGTPVACKHSKKDKSSTASTPDESSTLANAEDSDKETKEEETVA